MGFKSWLRKKLIDEATEQKPMPQKPLIPPFAFEIDKSRCEVVMSILQGQPFYAIFKSPTGIKTLTTGLTPAEIRTALNDIANQIPEMKEVLTNVAIDINTPQNAKQSENR